MKQNNTYGKPLPGRALGYELRAFSSTSLMSISSVVVKKVAVEERGV